MSFASIQDAAADIREGRMIIIVDDEDRENEGDLVCAAEMITPEKINFMARHARGLICLPLTEERCEELHLSPQVADNTSKLGTAFTVSIEARPGVTTGISAADRATTILTAVDQRTRPQDLARPGHIFPLRAKKGGVLGRPGQTEAAGGSGGPRPYLSAARQKRRRAGSSRTDRGGRRYCADCRAVSRRRHLRD